MDSTGAIIVCKNKVLLFHRDNISSIPDPDCWHFPGGLIDEGESPQQGIERELSEEVTYVPKLTYVARINTPKAMRHIFVAIVTEDEAKKFVKGPDEGQEIGFYTLAEMLQMKLTTNLRVYLNELTPLLSKLLDGETIPPGFFIDQV